MACRAVFFRFPCRPRGMAQEEACIGRGCRIVLPGNTSSFPSPFVYAVSMIFFFFVLNLFTLIFCKLAALVSENTPLKIVRRAQ